MIDLRSKDLDVVKGILARHVPECEVWAFGSRVNGRAKAHSDLDLSIVSERPLSPKTLALLEDDFTESDLPFRVDVLDWSSTSEGFREIILEAHEIIQPRIASIH